MHEIVRYTNLTHASLTHAPRTIAITALVLAALFSPIGPLSNTIFAQDETPPAAPTLSNLVLSRGLLSPAFAADVLSYTAAVRLDDARITVTPWPAGAGATVAYLDGDDNAIADADSETEGQQVDLDPGANTIKVRAPAPTGTRRGPTP